MLVFAVCVSLAMSAVALAAVAVTAAVCKRLAEHTNLPVDGHSRR